MKNNPDTAEMDAVKNDRFIVLSGLAMFPSLENTDVVEQIANAPPFKVFDQNYGSLPYEYEIGK